MLGGADTVYADADTLYVTTSRWPAVLAFGFVIWLELVAFVLGGRTLAAVILGYTLLSLAGMSYFGRDTWRRNAEVFSVWFGLLNRLAPYGLADEDDPESGRIERRPFAAALNRSQWTTAEIALVTLGTGSIIFDGLSQTQLYVQLIYQGSWPLPLPMPSRFTCSPLVSPSCVWAIGSSFQPRVPS